MGYHAEHRHKARRRPEKTRVGARTGFPAPAPSRSLRIRTVAPLLSIGASSHPVPESEPVPEDEDEDDAAITRTLLRALALNTH